MRTDLDPTGAGLLSTGHVPSGDQSGSVISPPTAPVLSLRARPPLAGMVKSRAPPCAPEVKQIVFPSGDQQGHASTSRVRVRRISADPSLLAPIGDFFNVDVEARLADEGLIHGLIYETY